MNSVIEKSHTVEDVFAVMTKGFPSFSYLQLVHKDTLDFKLFPVGWINKTENRHQLEERRSLLVALASSILLMHPEHYKYLITENSEFHPV